MSLSSIARSCLAACALALVAAVAPPPAFAQDVTAPTTTDDVPATYRTADVRVTLTATDAESAVTSIKYVIGTDPADPSLPGSAAEIYDRHDKPTLANGQKIRYFATDAAGNEETPKTSSAAIVSPGATNYYSGGWFSAFESSTYIFSLKVADFNGDGRPDMALMDGQSNRIIIWLKEASGSKASATAFP